MAVRNKRPEIIELQVRPPNDDRELLLQRICDLEMDNEILKQQLICVTAEMRQSFMEVAEKIDVIDSKLSSTMNDTTEVGPTRTHSSGTTDSQKFDAMACVETVMETSEQLLNTSTKEPVNIEEPTGNGPAEETSGRHRVEAMPLVTNVLPCTSEVDFNNNEIGSAIDTPQKRYCCIICNKTFCQSSGLSRHQKIHLKQQQQEVLLNSDVDKLAKPKRFFCTALFCKRGFTSRSGMMMHAKRTHQDPSIKPLIIPLVGLQPPMSSASLVPVEPLLDLRCPAEDAAARIDDNEEKTVVEDANEDMNEMVWSAELMVNISDHR